MASSTTKPPDSNGASSAALDNEFEELLGQQAGNPAFAAALHGGSEEPDHIDVVVNDRDDDAQTMVSEITMETNVSLFRGSLYQNAALPPEEVPDEDIENLFGGGQAKASPVPAPTPMPSLKEEDSDPAALSDVILKLTAPSVAGEESAEVSVSKTDDFKSSELGIRKTDGVSNNRRLQEQLRNQKDQVKEQPVAVGVRVDGLTAVTAKEKLSLDVDSKKPKTSDLEAGRPPNPTHDDPARNPPAPAPPALAGGTPGAYAEAGVDGSGGGGARIEQMLHSVQREISALDTSEANPLDIPTAEAVNAPQEVMQTGQPVQEARRKTQKLLWMLFGAVILLSVLVLLGFIILGRDDSDPSQEAVQASDTTALATAAPSVSTEAYVISLLPEDTQSALKDPITPQGKAFQWLMSDSKLQNSSNSSGAYYSDQRIIQRFALACIYHATEGDQWFNNTNWLSHDHHECEWYHNDIALTYFWKDPRAFTNPFLLHLASQSPPCEGDTGIYTDLWLLQNNMKGQLPDELYLLTSLQTVWLARNDFEGWELSTLIGNLQSLELFSLVNTGTGGTLPTQIGLLSNNLYHFTLTHNKFTGNIPSQLGQLSTALSFLLLEQNSLTGTIPTQIGSINKMSWFYTYGNSLTGTLPSELGRWGGLRPTRILAFGNHLMGTIPTQLFRLPTLATLGFFRNSISGTIPTQIGRAPQLDEISLGYNQITGPIPSQIGRVQPTGLFGPDFTMLALEHNQLTGTVPSELGEIPLVLLNLNHNGLEGSLPSQLGKLSRLSAFLVAQNDLTGNLPLELLPPSSQGGPLVALNLTGNSFSGTLSKELCEINATTPPQACPPPFGCGLDFDCSEDLCGCDCACKNNVTSI